MKVFKSIASVLFFCGILISTDVSAQFKLKIKGVTKKKGNLMIAIYDSESHFLDEDLALKRIVYPVSTLDVVIEINGLSNNTPYAIAIYHDVNKNGKLDTNFFGIPSEIYGFSNNARGTFGPPSFSETKVVCDKNNTLVIQLK